MRVKYLVLIIAIIVAGVNFSCNSGSDPLVPNPGDILKFVSADVCVGCHGSIAKKWERTGHAMALEGLLTSDHVQDFCYACHVVGLDNDPTNSGFDDPDPITAARFGDVQCEACHGAGSNHIVTKEPLIANLSDELCGGCHNGAHHPTYDEWQESAHAVALSRPSVLPYFGVDCLGCHSADYIFAESIPEDATLDDFEFGITCVVCHDPHSEENDYQLRTDPLTLCYQCHNHHDAIPGEDVHHPHGDMYQGMGGYEYPGETYEDSAHTFITEGCVACHMWTSPFNALGLDEDAISGHTFEPRIEACRECHSGAEDFNLGNAQSTIQGLLDELGAELDAATEDDMTTLSYERALFNLEFVTEDRSLGIHNFKYAQKLLTDAIEDFEPGS